MVGALTSGPITVESLNYDLTRRRSWTAELAEELDDVIVLLGEFDDEVSHPDLGVIRKGTTSKEFFFFDRWYNIFKFREPDGEFRNYYCNIAMPPTFDEDTLRYVDLDLDVLVDREGIVTVLDRDEFETNIEVFGYTSEIIRKVEDAIVELLRVIEQRDWPFERLGNLSLAGSE